MFVPRFSLDCSEMNKTRYQPLFVNRCYVHIPLLAPLDLIQNLRSQTFFRIWQLGWMFRHFILRISWFFSLSNYTCGRYIDLTEEIIFENQVSSHKFSIKMITKILSGFAGYCFNTKKWTRQSYKRDKNMFSVLHNLCSRGTVAICFCSN